MGEGEGRTVALMTVGCKLNQYETEGVAELFEQDGFTVVPFGERADVYVVNTCTVTSRSDYRSRQMLRRASRMNPQAVIVATGCYAQRDPDPLVAMPEVDLVVGNASKPDLPHLVLTANARGETIVKPLSSDVFFPFDIDGFRGYTRAFLKIQDGCDHRCSYCAVPDARGPARNRPYSDVLAQAEKLAANGYREIVLTGVHIGTFSASDGRGLSELLASLAAIDGLERIRLGSVEPRELSPKLASSILSIDKVCHHLHIPLESGSDRILEKMRRGYSRDEYASAVRRITDAEPLVGLGTDVMVGFPGETEGDFADTVSLIEELPFTYLHVFAFSPRKGTPAADMENRVPAGEKKRRSRHLRELGRAKSLAFRRGLVGRPLEVLVLEGSGKNESPPTGLAGNYVTVELDDAVTFRNKFVEVVVAGADDERTWAKANLETIR
jgi:threonylcarbamoyladenosine tRNA methylthiotransferase MtaB